MALIPFPGNCPHNVNKDAKYHVKSSRGEAVIALVYNSLDGERWHATTEGHPELVDMVNRVQIEARGVPNGSFYLNEYKQVIVPSQSAEQYYYAGTYDRPLRFEFEGKILCGDHMDLDGNPLSAGQIWVGPHPGIPYVLTAGGQDVYFEARPRPNVTRKLKLSDFVERPRSRRLSSLIQSTKGFSGGRFYVNEFGAIFAPVTDGEEWEYLYVGRLDISDWFPRPEIS